MAFTLNVDTPQNHKTFTVTWAGLANGASGTAFVVPENFGLGAIQATGTFGSGGSATMLGSNDGLTFGSLPSILLAGANAMTAAAPIAEVDCIALVVAPKVTAGDGTTALTVVANFVRRL